MADKVIYLYFIMSVFL